MKLTLGLDARRVESPLQQKYSKRVTMKTKPKYDLDCIIQVEKIIGKDIKSYAIEKGMHWRKAFKQLARKHKIQLKHVRQDPKEILEETQQQPIQESQLDAFSALLKEKGISFNRSN